MTAYTATGTSALGAASQFGVKFGSTWQARIVRVDIVTSTSGTAVFSKYTAGTISSGTSVTPFPLREGAPATTAAAKWGGTVSGTQNVLNSQIAGAAGTTLTFQPPFDLILSPGSVLWISGVNLTSASVYYEELHLVRSQ